MLNLTRPILRPRRKYFNFKDLKLYQDFRILYKEVARTNQSAPRHTSPPWNYPNLS